MRGCEKGGDGGTDREQVGREETVPDGLLCVPVNEITLDGLSDGQRGDGTQCTFSNGRR